jgi:polyisoprenoid-binding protein YceI
MRSLKALTLAALATVVTLTTAAGYGAATFTSRKFEGAKANTGNVIATVDMGHITLKVSDDFVIPDTPAPSWQVVDSKGNTYLLNQLKIKGDKYNRSIMLPSYIKDVVKVQIWCSWAEALLGEAPFDKIVK